MKEKTEMLVVFNDTQLYRNCDQEALGAALKFVNFYKKKITHFVFNGDISVVGQFEFKPATIPSEQGK